MVGFPQPFTRVGKWRNWGGKHSWATHLGGTREEGVGNLSWARGRKFPKGSLSMWMDAEGSSVLTTFTFKLFILFYLFLVCMICVYVYVHACVYICVWYICTCMYVCICVNICVCMSVHTLYICVYVWIYVYMSVCVCAHTWASMPWCIYGDQNTTFRSQFSFYCGFWGLTQVVRLTCVFFLLAKPSCQPIFRFTCPKCWLFI